MEVQTLRTNVMINSRRTGLITAVCLGTTFDLRPNYIPLQYPYHGPNLFSFDSNGHYEIDFDNNGLEDLALQIRLQNTACHLALRTGRDASKKTHTVPVPRGAPDRRGAHHDAWHRPNACDSIENWKARFHFQGMRRHNSSAPVAILRPLWVGVR